MSHVIALLGGVVACGLCVGLFYLTYFILSLFGQEDKLRTIFVYELIGLLLLAILALAYLFRLKAGGVPDYFGILG